MQKKAESSRSNTPANVLIASPNWIVTAHHLGLAVVIGVGLLWLRYSVLGDIYFSSGYMTFFWLLFLAPFARFGWIWLENKKTIYTLYSDRLRVQRGIILRTTDDLELFRVRDFQLNEPLLLRLFGLSNLVIVTSDRTTPMLTLEAIENGQEVLETMRNLVYRHWDDRGVREIDAG